MKRRYFSHNWCLCHETLGHWVSQAVKIIIIIIIDNSWSLKAIMLCEILEICRMIEW